MTIPNKFNLVDEPWIPVAGKGLVSLEAIFSDSSLSALGGNPVQKIALTKLLLAIAQTAYTPKDDEDWKNLGPSGMAEKSLAYLKQKKDLFWLYGQRPFLQIPKVKDIVLNDVDEKNKDPKKLGPGDFPNLPNDNNTILLQSEFKNNMDDPERALFILSLMSFALAGKQCHCNRRKPAIVGPGLGRACYLHTYVAGKSIQETIFLNLFSLDKIDSFKFFEEKIGVPIWEDIPESDDCAVARRLKKSYLGVLVPMCRFVFLVDKGIYMIEGLRYPNHKEGWREPSVAFNDAGKDIKVLRAEIAKKPWRQLVSLLSFVAGQTDFDCQQLRWGIDNSQKLQVDKISIWSGGICVTGDAFGQKVSGLDDFVESEIQLNVTSLGKIWFESLKREMDDLEKVALELKKSVYKANKRDIKESREKDKRADAISKEAETLFWQLCERKFQNLVDACADSSGERTKVLRCTFARFVNKAYDTYCPKNTARQLDAWAEHRPKLAGYWA